MVLPYSGEVRGGGMHLGHWINVPLEMTDVKLAAGGDRKAGFANHIVVPLPHVHTPHSPSKPDSPGCPPHCFPVSQPEKSESLRGPLSYYFFDL